MRCVIQLAFLIAAMLASLPAAFAQETRLLFSSISPAKSDNSQFFAQWAQRIADQSNGAVKVDIRDGNSLATFSNVYDRVRDDVIQIGWAIHQVIGGRFPLSEVAGVPFLATGGPEASVALWRLYKSGKLDGEYKEVVPLFYAILPPAYIHFAKTPASLDTLAGIKVAVSGRLPGAFVAEMGGTPVSMNTGEMYEMLQRGTVEAAIISWGGFSPYKLQEVTSYHVEAPLGQATSMFFMSRRKSTVFPRTCARFLMRIPARRRQPHMETTSSIKASHRVRNSYRLRATRLLD